VACSPFIFPESRFRMRWLGDELVAPLEEARHWLDDNPCPDEEIGEHLRAMLVAYSKMPGATVLQMMELRNVIQQHAEAVDRRSAPSQVDASPSEHNPGERYAAPRSRPPAAMTPSGIHRDHAARR
jgi:hypothetical protein